MVQKHHFPVLKNGAERPMTALLGAALMAFFEPEPFPKLTEFWENLTRLRYRDNPARARSRKQGAPRRLIRRETARGDSYLQGGVGRVEQA